MTSTWLADSSIQRRLVRALHCCLASRCQWEITKSLYPHKSSPTAFSLDEESLLSPRAGFNGHALVSVSGSAVTEGATLAKSNSLGLQPPWAISPDSKSGTRFLSQFQGDLGALLDAQLTAHGDLGSITQDLLNQIIASISPALGFAGNRIVSLLVLFLDPLSFNLVDPEGRSLEYNQQSNVATNKLPLTYLSVVTNLELVVIPDPSGTYQLNVAQAAAHSRGGLVFIGNDSTEARLFTGDIARGLRYRGNGKFFVHFQFRPKSRADGRIGHGSARHRAACFDGCQSFDRRDGDAGKFQFQQSTTDHAFVD